MFPESPVAGQTSCTFSITSTNVPSIGGPVESMTLFDDGGGAELVIAGTFDSAGGQPANRIAAWDGIAWKTLGDGLNSSVLDLLSFPNGSRQTLIAGGHFIEAGGAPANHVAAWDGVAWSSLGEGLPDPVFALGIYDTNAGPTLLAATATSKLYQWDGLQWTLLAEFDNWVFAIEQFKGNLYVGGAFTSVNAQQISGIARWDGQTWSEVDGGTNSGVGDLFAFDDGSGLSLFVGGSFTEAGGQPADHIARWNGSEWSYLPADGLDEGAMGAFAALDGSLYVGSSVPTDGDAFARVSRWDGSTWTPVGNIFNFVDASLSSMISFDDGGPNGPQLFVGGRFQSAGGVVSPNLARWDGEMWLPGPGPGDGLGGTARALHVFDDGSGPALYAGGQFLSASNIAALRIAKWDGAHWSAVGSGMNGSIWTFATFDDGSGPALFAAGAFTEAGGKPANRIAKWNGEEWTALGSGIDSPSSLVRALAVYDDGSGPALYAGGVFTSAGGAAVNNIARWNGTTWSDVGGGSGGVFPGIHALAVFDDGTGPALYAGGFFTEMGGAPASKIAKWNGQSWSPLGDGVAGFEVIAMHVFDDGKTGPSLYVGGDFLEAGGVPVKYIARWNGAWSAVGDISLYDAAGVSAFEVFDDGGGAALYASSVTNSGLGRWNGTFWASLANDQDLGGATSLASFVDSAGQPALYMYASGFKYWHDTATQLAITNHAGDYLVPPDDSTFALWVEVQHGGATTYQWRRDGIPLVNAPGQIQGAQSDRLIVIGATPEDAGQYDVIVNNDCSSVASGPIVVTVPKYCHADVGPISGKSIGDGIVDVDDLLVVINNWGQCFPSEGCEGDINNDFNVTYSDLLMVIDAWGPCP